MTNFLAVAVGLAFTLVVCLVVLQALLGPWLHVRRSSAAAAAKSGERQPARTAKTRDAAPIHSA